MPSVLIRNVDDALHKRLKDRAASHRRSLGEEARELLRVAVARDDQPEREHIVDAAARLFGKKYGFDLDLPDRNSEPERAPPDFSDWP